MNLLVSLIAEGLTSLYVTKNAAPRAVYEARLTKSHKRSEYSHLFTGSGFFTTSGKDTFDSLVVDEAHRLNEKSGLFGNLGENQVKEIIQAGRFSVFFVDESQKVTLKDVGDKDVIRHWARESGATIHEMRLESQFRCNGSEAYLARLDGVLGIHETLNEVFNTAEFDFRVVDSAPELMGLVKTRNEERNRARVVAGYCWKWRSKRDPAAMDIVLPGFQAQWNLTKDGSLWIEAPQSVREVGCIHTCQGLEVDYIGVIIGEDLVLSGREVRVQLEKRATTDQSIRGWRNVVRDSGPAARAAVELTVRNTYRTLMTRGMKGCYVVLCGSRARRASPIPARVVSSEWLRLFPSNNRMACEASTWGVSLGRTNPLAGQARGTMGLDGLPGGPRSTSQDARAQKEVHRFDDARVRGFHAIGGRATRHVEPDLFEESPADAARRLGVSQWTVFNWRGRAGRRLRAHSSYHAPSVSASWWMPMSQLPHPLAPRSLLGGARRRNRPREGALRADRIPP